MYIKNKRGQSTVEYVILAGAVIAVIIFLVIGKNSLFQSTLVNSVNQEYVAMNAEAGALAGSYAAQANVITNGTPPYQVPVTP